LLLGLAAFLPIKATAATFGELMAWCAPREGDGEPNLCNAYLQEDINLLRSHGVSEAGKVRVCIPQDVDHEELIGLMRDYARRNPSSLDRQGIDGLREAVKDRYPCR
jgi:hypothetical protein